MGNLGRWTQIVGSGLIVGLNLAGCGGVVDEEAEARFRNRLGETSITVFATLVRAGEACEYDRESARQIAAYFADHGLASVQPADAQVPLDTEWGMNQARMYRDSALGFGEWLKENPVDTDYALLAEYLLSRNGTVMGIHAYLLEAGGTPAFGVGRNSHHAEFQAVNPQNVGDCTTVLLRALENELDESAHKSATRSAWVEIDWHAPAECDRLVAERLQGLLRG